MIENAESGKIQGMTWINELIFWFYETNTKYTFKGEKTMAMKRCKANLPFSDADQGWLPAG